MRKGCETVWYTGVTSSRPAPLIKDNNINNNSTEKRSDNLGADLLPSSINFKVMVCDDNVSLQERLDSVGVYLTKSTSSAALTVPRRLYNDGTTEKRGSRSQDLFAWPSFGGSRDNDDNPIRSSRRTSSPRKWRSCKDKKTNSARIF